MKQTLLLVVLLGVIIACKSEDGPATIPNGNWVMDKIKFEMKETEYELSDPPAARITIQDNAFSYNDTGGALSGSWTLNPSAMELSVTNPDGTNLTFPLVSFSNERWSFIAIEVNPSAANLTSGEEAVLDMVNMKLIDAGKDFDTEMQGVTSIKVIFELKKE